MRFEDHPHLYIPDALTNPPSELMRHVMRKRALRCALAALTDAWPGNVTAARDIKNVIMEALGKPPASGCDEDFAGSLQAVKDAVDVALAGLPDIAFCSRYPEAVGVAVRALMASQ